jgi:hypothetical protein
MSERLTAIRRWWFDFVWVLGTPPSPPSPASRPRSSRRLLATIARGHADAWKDRAGRRALEDTTDDR